MKLRKSRWRFALGVSFGLGVGLLQPAMALAQQPPTLPETKVEGRPAPVQAPAAPPAQTDTTPAPSAPSSPVSPGTAFSSPAADGYKAGSSTTGTKIDIPQLSFPGVVDVIPQELARDQHVL